MDQGIRNHASRLEIIAYLALAIVIAIGHILAVVNPEFFGTFYVGEDRFLEYSTALMMFLAGLIVSLRYLQERNVHSTYFAIISLIMAAVFFFVAGEEVSWGQRIFGFGSGEFFLQNNQQNETNFHNLKFLGINLNKLIFAKMLTPSLILIFLILPYLYSREGKLHRLMNHIYFPVPKIHHGLAMLLAGVSVELIPHSRRGELNEVALGVFALLLVLRAQNVRHN